MKNTKKEYIPASIREYVKEVFPCCVACGTWDADNCGHIIAESNGGAMVKENFVRLCGACNRAQGVVNVVFASYAGFALDPATVIARRIYWVKYCSTIRCREGAKNQNPNWSVIKPFKPL